MSVRRFLRPGGNPPTSTDGPVEAGLPRTALPVRAGIPFHLADHLQRLEDGALALGLSVGWLPDLREELKDWLLSATKGGDAALRLVLDPRAGLLSAKLESLPATPQPYRLALIYHPLGPRQLDPTLRHKGLSGSWGMAIQAEALRLDANDALLLWPDDTVAETGIAAVGVEADDVFLVPPHQGRVTSLTERLELPEWAESRGLRIQVQAIPVHRARLGRIWCMNALRGIWPATLL